MSFNPSKTSNHFYYAEPLQEDCLSFPVVGKMAEDSSGRLWICTEGGGLNCYNADTGIFTRYQHRKGDAVVWVVIISSQYSIEKKMNGYMLVLILGEYLCWI